MKEGNCANEMNTSEPIMKKNVKKQDKIKEAHQAD